MVSAPRPLSPTALTTRLSRRVYGRGLRERSVPDPLPDERRSGSRPLGQRKLPLSRGFSQVKSFRTSARPGQKTPRSDARRRGYRRCVRFVSACSTAAAIPPRRYCIDAPTTRLQDAGPSSATRARSSASPEAHDCRALCRAPASKRMVERKGKSLENRVGPLGPARAVVFMTVASVHQRGGSSGCGPWFCGAQSAAKTSRGRPSPPTLGVSGLPTACR